MYTICLICLIYSGTLLESSLGSFGGFLSSASTGQLDHAASLRVDIQDRLCKQRHSSKEIACEENRGLLHSRLESVGSLTRGHIQGVDETGDSGLNDFLK